jgi:hypothetical protein
MSRHTGALQENDDKKYASEGKRCVRRSFFVCKNHIPRACLLAVRFTHFLEENERNPQCRVPTGPLISTVMDSSRKW